MGLHVDTTAYMFSSLEDVGRDAERRAVSPRQLRLGLTTVGPRIDGRVPNGVLLLPCTRQRLNFDDCLAVRREIIRTVLYCVVYDSCVQ